MGAADGRSNGDSNATSLTSCWAAAASSPESILAAATAASKKAEAGNRARPLTRWSCRKASAGTAKLATKLQTVVTVRNEIHPALRPCGREFQTTDCAAEQGSAYAATGRICGRFPYQAVWLPNLHSGFHPASYLKEPRLWLGEGCTRQCRTGPAQKRWPLPRQCCRLHCTAC